MARPPRLTEDDILERLARHTGWTRTADTIHKRYTPANFASAIGFINAVAVLAETADHHPDISLHGWNKVDISLSTHDQGGLTELDFNLAAGIDDLGI